MGGKLLVLIGVAAALAAAITAAGGANLSAGPAAATRCKPGSTPGVIGGKHVCLRAGQRCNRRQDKSYHRYRFHCRSLRLVAFPKAPSPPPPPPPPQPPPLPGQKIDVGGYRLYIECVGAGSPTVILEPGSATAGATTTLAGWKPLREMLGANTRVCAYDRAGLGASDKRPAGVVPTGARFADELHALLAGANVPGPYILVGASYAGLIVPSHVARYPGDYVGIVFVDAEGPCPVQCSFDLPEPGVFDVGSVTYGDRPVVVLTSVLFVLDGPDLARRSTNSMLVNAPNSGHNIPGDNAQLVADAVRLVLAAVRAGTPLPPCEATALPADGGHCEAFAP